MLTAEAVAVNEALVDPAVTVTDEGTETTLVLLASATANPPEPAAPVSETEHASETFPVKELLLHVNPLREAAAATGFSWREKVWVTLPSEAVSVAVCEDVTAETVAVNVALVAPAATVTEEGTETAALLLLKETVKPGWLAAAVSVTVQASVPEPVRELLLQLRLLRLPLFFACPWPLRCTFCEPPRMSALVNRSVPLAVPVEAGVNAIPIDVDWLGCNVKGRLVCPDRLKPAPVTVTFVTVIGAELLLVTCTWLVLVWPTTTEPKSTLDGDVSNEVELLLGCGAPHPAIRIISKPTTAANAVLRVRMRPGERFLSCSWSCFRRGTSMVRGWVLELPGEE